MKFSKSLLDEIKSKIEISDIVGKRVALNLEYFGRLKHKDDGSLEFDRIFNQNYNSLGIGVDIEAGGHVFQFHFSNTNTMNEQAFMFETNKTWEKGEICFGFNILREFFCFLYLSYL